MDIELRDHFLGIKRSNSSTLKTSLNVFRSYSGLESGVERGKEVLLGNVGYTCPHHPLDLLAVYRLEWAETPNIERLKNIRRVGRYIEGNNIVLLIVELEVGQVVAIVAVEDQETINPSYSSFGILIKVLNLF
jgi:hypothetical protein